MDKPKFEVFISYSSKDKSEAYKLADALEEKGIKAWTDKELKAGANWREEIESALKRSRFFLLLVSKTSLASPWTNFEMGVALSRMASSKDVHIIPVLIEDFAATSLPPFLRDLQSVNLENTLPSEVAEKIRAAL